MEFARNAQKSIIQPTFRKYRNRVPFPFPYPTILETKPFSYGLDPPRREGHIQNYSNLPHPPKPLSRIIPIGSQRIDFHAIDPDIHLR